MEMYSTHNEGKSVVAERFAKTLSNKTDKEITSISKIVYTYNFDEIAKVYTPNWSEEVFVIKKFKNTVEWTYIISDLRAKEIVGKFYKKELKKQTKKSLELKINKKKKW